MPSPNYCIVITVRNESPYILEWIAYHTAIGFDHFVFFSNDNTDGTERLLDELATLPNIEHYDNPDNVDVPELAEVMQKNPQVRAYVRALQLDSVKAADWVMFIDIDEFLVLDTCETVDDFVKLYPGVDAIAINWRNYGSSSEAAFSTDPVLDRFQKASTPTFRSNGLIKSIARGRAIRTMVGAHFISLLPGKIYCHEDGRRFTNYYYLGYQTFANARINHYPIKSSSEYLMRRSRGDVNFFPKDQQAFQKYDIEYFFENDRNDVTLPIDAALMQRTRDGIGALSGIGRVKDILAECLIVWARGCGSLLEEARRIQTEAASREKAASALGATAKSVLGEMQRAGTNRILLDRVAVPFRTESVKDAKLYVNKGDFLSALDQGGSILHLGPMNAYNVEQIVDKLKPTHLTIVDMLASRIPPNWRIRSDHGREVRFFDVDFEKALAETPDDSLDKIILERPGSGVGDLMRALISFSFKLKRKGLFIIENYTAFSLSNFDRAPGIASINEFSFRYQWPVQGMALDVTGSNTIALRRPE